MPDSASTDSTMHQAALRIARRCRHVVQACLREEEWADADREFYLVVREELETYRVDRFSPAPEAGGDGR